MPCNSHVTIICLSSSKTLAFIGLYNLVTSHFICSHMQTLNCFTDCCCCFCVLSAFGLILPPLGFFYWGGWDLIIILFFWGWGWVQLMVRLPWLPPQLPDCSPVLLIAHVALSRHLSSTFPLLINKLIEEILCFCVGSLWC